MHFFFIKNWQKIDDGNKTSSEIWKLCANTLFDPTRIGVHSWYGVKSCDIFATMVHLRKTQKSSGKSNENVKLLNTNMKTIEPLHTLFIDGLWKLWMLKRVIYYSIWPGFLQPMFSHSFIWHLRSVRDVSSFFCYRKYGSWLRSRLITQFPQSKKKHGIYPSSEMNNNLQTSVNGHTHTNLYRD